MDGADKGAVVITGCSSGVGWATALRLDGLGYRVFAGVRKATDAERLQQAASPRLTTLMLDITDHASVAAAAVNVREAMGAEGLVGLINNAGGGLSGPLEFTPWEEFVQQVSLNLLGHVDMIRAFLGLVRQGEGRIVNVGSVGGMLPLPFSSAYSASKAGLAILSASLRLELAPQGVPVVLIVPGAIATRIWDKLASEHRRLGANLPEEGQVLYGAMMEEFGRMVGELSQVGVAPDSVARLIVHAMTWPTPKEQYLIGKDVPRQPKAPHGPAGDA